MVKPGDLNSLIEITVDNNSESNRAIVFAYLTMVALTQKVELAFAHTPVSVHRLFFYLKKLYLKANYPKKKLFIDEAMHNNLYDFKIDKEVIKFNS